MTSADIPPWAEKLGVRTPRPPVFFKSVEELERAPQVVPQAHLMRRAFRELELDGILCIESAPAVYFKVVEQFDDGRIARLHRLLWNQGLAPVLVLIGGTEVRIYSGLVEPSNTGQPPREEALVKALDFAADALEIRRLALAVESGEFFRVHAKAFDPNLRVDRRLLENLTTARELLLKKSRSALREQTVDRLLCRLVFACYLIDRGVIDPPYFDAIGLHGACSIRDLLPKDRAPAEARERLFVLFQALKGDFNGDLFEGELDKERDLITDAHIAVLVKLFNGEELKSGQLSFLTYEFGVIPIETISSIYEHFLRSSDPAGKKLAGAFYTPRFLAEVVLDTAIDGLGNLPSRRMLDPACGSGIFLVGFFNRIAEEWARANPHATYDERVDALIELLRDKIVGVDSNGTACRIAAFSLYLALLDQLDPPAIRRLKERGRRLPPLVYDPVKAVRAAARDWGATLYNADFADAPLPKDPEEEFDLVVGNPPWVSRAGREKVTKGAKGKGAAKRKVPPPERPPLLRWCDDQDPPLPVAQEQLTYGFMWKAPRHLKAGGRCCLLVPKGVLLNHQDKSIAFQATWFQAHAVERVINLADLRRQLFEGLEAPALVVRFRPEPPTNATSRTGRTQIEYFAPKTEWAGYRADLLVVSAADRTLVDQMSIVHALERGEAPTVWKERLWGTPRDWLLLERLAGLPKLDRLLYQPSKGERREGLRRWVVGQGFQPEKDNRRRKRSKARPWGDHTRMVEGKQELNLLLAKDECPPLKERYPWLRRYPFKSRAIFHAPHVLVSQGLRVAFADFPAVFRHALQGIHGPRKDETLLLFLAAALASPVTRYFCFHTSAYWGVERSKVELQELRRTPFWLPSEAKDPAEATAIVEEVAGLMRAAKTKLRSVLGRDFTREIVREKVEQLIYRYYGVGELERVLIEDTVAVSIPSATPNRPRRHAIPALEPSDPAERSRYTDCLCEMLNEWASGGPLRVSASRVVSRAAGLAVVALAPTREDPPPLDTVEESSSARVDSVLRRIEEQLSAHHGSVVLNRGLTVAAGQTLYVVKPLALRFWTRTAALNDADAIFSYLNRGQS